MCMFELKDLSMSFLLLYPDIIIFLSLHCMLCMPCMGRVFFCTSLVIIDISLFHMIMIITYCFFSTPRENGFVLVFQWLPEIELHSNKNKTESLKEVKKKEVHEHRKWNIIQIRIKYKNVRTTAQKGKPQKSECAFSLSREPEPESDQYHHTLYILFYFFFISLSLSLSRICIYLYLYILCIYDISAHNVHSVASSSLFRRQTSFVEAIYSIDTNSSNIVHFFFF